VDLTGFERLLTARGQAVLAEATEADLTESGLLATATKLRERYPAELVAAALTQARLRLRARDKFGADADRMYFTPAGLEQSTRASVAAYRARRFAAHGPVLELGCGIGADLLARVRAGAGGTAVDRDPLTAAVARANLAAFGLSERASVRVADAAGQDPRGYAAVFADPGRRTARGRVFDPKAYEPPLDTVLALAGQAPAACVKVAPGIPHEAVPAAAEAEWISVRGEVKEAALWLGELSGPVRRRATLIGAGDEPVTLTPGTSEPPPVRGWGRYLYEPDGAVIRAGLVADVAAATGGGLIDEQIAYVTADAHVPTPFAAAYAIEDVRPFSLKDLRAELRRREVGTLTLKKRGSAVDLDRLRRDLRQHHRGGAELTVVLTRVGRAPVMVLAHPIKPAKPAKPATR
jgi:SAM-dependent methyltransferase